MNQFEYLPNETLIDIFEYFDARDVYQAFYNLNSRLNNLLQSLNNLCLTLNENNDYKNFAPYLQSLKLGDKVNINLNDLINLRYLYLLTPSNKQLKQLETDIYPCLEHLSIDCNYVPFAKKFPDLWKKILSNGFPYLKSCELFQSTLILTEAHSIQSTQLRCLKIDIIDFFTYQLILSSCPSLDLFQFSIPLRPKESCFIKPHLMLKKLHIRFSDFITYWDEYIVHNYFVCVPNLEQLVVYAIDYAENIENHYNYQWFALSINRYFHSLHQFKFYLFIIHCEPLWQDENRDFLNELQDSFKQIHSDRYRSKLNIDVSTSLCCKNARYVRDYRLEYD